MMTLEDLFDLQTRLPEAAGELTGSDLGRAIDGRAALRGRACAGCRKTAWFAVHIGVSELPGWDTPRWLDLCGLCFTEVRVMLQDLDDDQIAARHQAWQAARTRDAAGRGGLRSGQGARGKGRGSPWISPTR